jgi:sulfatase maturation enzyme AslB (radical SAM superfamily)
MSFLARLRDKLSPPEPLPPGMHAYERRDDAGGRVRLHLRVEPDGRGLLVINAARMLHLNQTAAEYARLILEQAPEEQAVRTICRRYQVDSATAQADYGRLRKQIETLIDPNATVCPIHGLDLERVDPFSVALTAPYRMDLALTYRCNNDCPHCYVARPKNYPELETTDWKAILDRIWEAGIPHVCFTGGEATLHPDLAELIAYADEKGIVTGLLTNGRRLADAAYVQMLITAGLDHVQITLESREERVHTTRWWQPTARGVRRLTAFATRSMPVCTPPPTRH